jgi:hypothetical protein
MSTSTYVSTSQLDWIDCIVIVLIAIFAVFNSVDEIRNEIDPDRLMNGLDSSTSSAEMKTLYDVEGVSRYRDNEGSEE